MEIIDEQTFEEYFTTVFQKKMTEIEITVSGNSERENRFQKDKRRLDYFAKFLAEYQYFDKTVEKKPFLEIFRNTFIFLSKWERQYTKELGENSVQTLNYQEKRDQFRHTMRSFVNRIIDTRYRFNRDDRTHMGQDYDLDALTVLETFTKDYSLLLIDLITYES